MPLSEPPLPITPNCPPACQTRTPQTPKPDPPDRSSSSSVTLGLDGSVRRIDADGHLHIATCILSAATVCPYYGHEIPNAAALGLDPDRLYQVYRDPAALAAAAASMAGKPILMRHQPVSAQAHPSMLTVGAVGSDVRFTPPNLTASLTVWDSAAITAILNGRQRAVSAGYRYRAIPHTGSHDGTPYTLVMADIVFNHLALVTTPRVTTAIIGDASPTQATDHKAPEPPQHTHSEPTVPLTAQAATPLQLPTQPMPQRTEHPATAQSAAPHTSTLSRPTAPVTRTVSPALQELPFPPMPHREQQPQVVHMPPIQALSSTVPSAPVAQKTSQYGADGASASALTGTATHKAVAAPEPHPQVVSSAVAPHADGAPVAGLDAAIAQAVQQAEAGAMRRMEALHTARTAVRPFVGDVTMDSAAAVYAFALRENGVDPSGLPEAALQPLFQQFSRLKTQALGTGQGPSLGLDSAKTVSFREEFGLTRITVKA
ncbi:phage-like protein [Acetobacter indonesiensis NRIC 0313]|uniref:Phage related protein n=1 Tax=Acetobacter indonesiensis TaxID=104101 RepID=A0A6N3T952_9PROT|nr:DUF2213 domain-containing protein [Acetobacter indonesiensis]GAN63180.1 phage related protein [Acetobacter indonesiensis]GBQ55560.1 phage-like protein [Acetobacter indonesiensis NRIC 0313]GEN04129.1 hypothetical protein AIN02nite_21540 [Acetobacter indonesiensis]